MSGIFPPHFDAMDAVLQQRTMARLIWQYGEDRARVISRGDDPLTNLDIAKWNALGIPKRRREGVEL